MKSQVGLWIDHRGAVIVTLTDDTEQIERITSDVKDAVSNADAPHVSQQDRHNKRVKAHLTQYYGRLITAIRDAGAILIFGPGEAKYEFEKKLQRRGLGSKIVSTEATDNMTEPQIVAKVRQQFVSQ